MLHVTFDRSAAERQVRDRRECLRVIVYIRRIYRLGHEVHTSEIFYRCYRHCAKKGDNAKRAYRLAYEKYDGFVTLLTPADYALPPEVTNALKGDYTKMHEPW